MAQKYLPQIKNEKEARKIIKNSAGKYGNTIFKGTNTPAFASCDAMKKELFSLNNCNGCVLRTANESPLTKNKICADFYNSIVLRDPILHRLSMLAFENKHAVDTAAIYCHSDHLCHNEEMNNFLNLLFNATYSKKSTQISYQLDEKFSIRRNGKSKMNPTFLTGLLSNLYTRWIGYDHDGNDNNDGMLQALFVDYRAMEVDAEMYLQNAQRVLIGYDYVIPLDADEFNSTHFIWQYYAKEVKKHILRLDIKEQNEYFEWPHENHHVDGPMSTQGLMDVFEKSGELDLLIERNQIDIKLFAFAKQLANADMLFYEMIGE